jgi:hypothetical protein
MRAYLRVIAQGQRVGERVVSRVDHDQVFSFYDPIPIFKQKYISRSDNRSNPDHRSNQNQRHPSKNNFFCK